VDIVTQDKHTLYCDVPTDNGQTIEVAVDIVTQNQQTVQCGVLTDSGQTVEDSIRHIDTEPTDGTV
jgi:hypothetical protein